MELEATVVGAVHVQQLVLDSGSLGAGTTLSAAAAGVSRLQAPQLTEDAPRLQRALPAHSELPCPQSRVQPVRLHRIAERVLELGKQLRGRRSAGIDAGQSQGGEGRKLGGN